MITRAVTFYSCLEHTPPAHCDDEPEYATTSKTCFLYSAKYGCYTCGYYDHKLGGWVTESKNFEPTHFAFPPDMSTIG